MSLTQTRRIAFVLTVATAATILTMPASASGGEGRGKGKDHKVGICHATSSKTNPYVYIVVSKNAAEAHAKHHDGRDKIGVSSKDSCHEVAIEKRGKPERTESKGQTEKENKGAPIGHPGKTKSEEKASTEGRRNSDHKVGICHATSSKTNPYVYIVVSKNAAEAHAKHHDGRDKIGATSAKDCEVKAEVKQPGKGGGTVPVAAKPATPAAPVAAKPASPAAPVAAPVKEEAKDAVVTPVGSLPQTGAGLLGAALMGIGAAAGAVAYKLARR